MFFVHLFLSHALILAISFPHLASVFFPSLTTGVIEFAAIPLRFLQGCYGIGTQVLILTQYLTYRAISPVPYVTFHLLSITFLRLKEG